MGLVVRGKAGDPHGMDGRVAVVVVVVVVV
jgi:hypothetical protein